MAALPMRRNTAIAAAKGEFIAFLDSDDIAFPHRIEIQVDIIQHPEADAVFGRVKLVDVYGNPCGTWEDDEIYILPEEITERLPVANCVSQPAAMVRKSAFLLLFIIMNTKTQKIGDYGWK
ncbi:MAG: glycosyltransferase [Flavobacteriales bacterium]